MAKVTPEQGAAKWAARLAGATEDIRRGVEGVSVAPGQRAAAQRAAWRARILASEDKWARNVAAVSLESWKAATLEKGIARIAQGAQAAQPKMQGFLQEFLPHLERGMSQVKSMPKVTLEDSIARMVTMVRHNSQFKRGSTGR